MLQPATVALHASEAVGQDAAGEEFAKLLLDESWQAGAVAAFGRFTDERLQVLAHHRMEHGVRGVSGPI